MSDTPTNNLPSYKECRLRVDNSEYIKKMGRTELDQHGMYANPIHEFIYEYDDVDPHKSAWFLHRLEKLIQFVRDGE